MNESYFHGLLGGLLIGVAAVVLLWLNGRTMGVSTIASSLLAKPTKNSFWRWAFIAGLVLGGWLVQLMFAVEIVIDASWTMLIVAGLLVGLGTVIGNGCTSGHGICGIARLSKRSIVATVVFMAAGIVTVWLKNIWGG